MQIVLEVYSNLSKCDEFVGLSQSESYFVTLNQRWCFLPLFWPLKVQALLLAMLADSCICVVPETMPPE